MATLAAGFASREQIADPNVVKVVVGLRIADCGLRDSAHRAGSY